MGDVAHILGIQSTGAEEKDRAITETKSKNTHELLSKQAIDAVTFTKSSDYESANLPPIVPDIVRINNKLILSNKKARPWCWAPFASNARNDGLVLHHWVRAGVEYPEYPFARFNIHLDRLNYDDVEDRDAFYQEYLQDDNWTQSETDTLLELCKAFELRWPVIADRWIGRFGSMSNKKIEDLQHRYYTIGMILNRRLVHKAAKVEAENLAKALAAAQGSLVAPGTIASNTDKNTLSAEHALATAVATSSSSDVSTVIGDVTSSMQPLISSTNTGTSNQPTFDLKTERQRRRILDLIWERTKEEELEEESLREELKLVEAQIRKLKKSGGHLLGTAVAPVLSRGPSPVPPSGADAIVSMDINSSYDMLNEQFSSTAPTPTPGIPYLQSGRLVPPATGGQFTINKTTLKRMEQILNELSVKDRPLPTNRVCDMYDHVRKGALTLLTLQKIMLKRESDVINKRMKLEKVAGATAAKEAAIRSEAAAAAAAAAAQKATAVDKKTKNSLKDGGSSKAKSGGGEPKKKSTKKKAAPGDKPAGETKKRKAPSKKSSESKPVTADTTTVSDSSPASKKTKTTNT